MTKYFSFLLLSFSIFGFSQKTDSDYARSVINQLTSESYAGRGYVDEGMNKTAEFIAEEFEKFGLKKIGDSYFQEFSMPINIIREAKLKINGKELKYGVDFLVDPASKSQSFHPRPIYYFNPNDFARSLNKESDFIDFIRTDMLQQKEKHVVFPPHHFEVDSLNQYYKHWPHFYRPEENRNRAIFHFSKDKLTASLSQTEQSFSRFFVNDNFYSDSLTIDDYLIENEFIVSYKTKNIIGLIEGENKDSLILITAHFDHLGKVGNTIFPGASDNASGTAFLLELAKYFSQNKPKYSLVFIGFAAEEAGLVGSKYFVKNPLVDLAKIKFLLNFDIMGAGEEGIQIVNSSVFTKEYELLNQINSKNNYLKQIKKRGEACNSDHCPFYEKGIPSFFTYTLGGPGHYHDVFDTSESLNLAEFEDLKNLFIEFIQNL